MKALAFTVLFGMLASPGIARELLISTPTVVTAEVAAADANGFIVAGTNSFSAWAQQFSTYGKPVWEYTSGAVSRGYPTRIPKYVGVAPMPDGSTFLCGTRPPDPLSSDTSALLTHVDHEGKRLSETTISPAIESSTPARYSTFQSCLTSGPRVLIQGMVLRATKDGRPGSGTQWHWFVDVDSTGKIIWQHEVPERSYQEDLGNVLLQRDEGFYFSSTDNHQTELLRLSSSGGLLSHVTLAGAYHLVRSLKGESRPSLWGTNQGRGELIEFDDQLNEVGRATEPVPASMSTSAVYRLQNGTFFVFGSNTHHIGQRVRPLIANIDTISHRVRSFEPSWKSQNVVVDLRAVAPLDADGLFISAVGLLNSTATTSAIKGAGARGSLALDYIRPQ